MSAPLPQILLTEGRFGRCVAGRMAESVPDLVVLDLRAALRSMDDLVSRASFVALALWRRYPAAAELVDAACARYRVPWSGAILEGRRLVIGPLVMPGKGPCHICYRKRWATHAPLLQREEALDGAYQADPDLGFAGFPPGVAAVACSCLALDKAEADTAPGRIRIFDMLNCSLDETRVVRVHGCERCGQAAPPGTRYLRHLLPALRDLGAVRL